MNKKNLGRKGEKGITLVALIITIIVLLILAVVAIRAVSNDGIISHAKNAQTGYEKAQAEEEQRLLELEYQIASAQGTATGTYDEYVLDKKYGLKIGDKINYDESNGQQMRPEIKDLDWVVFGVDDLGRVEIISTEPTSAKYPFGLYEDITDCSSPAESMNNNIRTYYGRGTGAIECRALTVEDLNELTGFNPSTDYEGYGTKYAAKIFLDTEANEYRAYYIRASSASETNLSLWTAGSSIGAATGEWFLEASEENLGVVKYVDDTSYEYSVELRSNLSELIIGKNGEWKNFLLPTSKPVFGGSKLTSGIFELNNGSVKYHYIWTPGGYASLSNASGPVRPVITIDSNFLDQLL